MSPGLGQAGRSGVREADLARDQIAAALPPGVHVSVREPRPGTPVPPQSPSLTSESGGLEGPGWGHQEALAREE